MTAPYCPSAGPVAQHWSEICASALAYVFILLCVLQALAHFYAVTDFEGRAESDWQVHPFPMEMPFDCAPWCRCSVLLCSFGFCCSCARVIAQSDCVQGASEGEQILSAVFNSSASTNHMLEHVRLPPQNSFSLCQIDILHLLVDIATGFPAYSLLASCRFSSRP